LAWCRGCRAWLPCAEVARGGACRKHLAEEVRRHYKSNEAYRLRRRQHSHAKERDVDPIPVEGQEVILELFDGHCAYCERPAETWDHVVAVANGGQTVPWNIVPACRSCNSSKGTSDLWDWLEKRGRAWNPYLVEHTNILTRFG
jgi:5-methylcytosine-specific restriction endonuclease McrA